jgi:Ca2+-transporting ATPase
VHHNYFFIAVSAIMIGCQIMIMFVGGRAFSIERINGKDWGISIVLSALCLPWAVLIRVFPDLWFEKIVKVTTWPLMVVWRPTSRVLGRMAKKMKRNKKVDNEKVDEEEQTPVAPEINIEEEGRPVDVEKGSPEIRRI